MRGWLHLGAAPAALIAGAILLLVSPPSLRIPIAIYVLSTVTLFTISATYHRVNWRPEVRIWMQRVDHSAIFVLIAGSYTAITAAVIGGQFALIASIVAWSAALTGILVRLLWHSAPSWLFVPCYLVFGVSAVTFIPSLLSNGGGLIVGLVAFGGTCYIVGAIIFATRFPNPSPRWFGFHEVFHSLTLGGYISHFVAITIGVLGIGTATLH